MLTTSKPSINIGDMVRLTPDFLPPWFSKITMYEGDKSPWNARDEWNAREHDFSLKDIGIVVLMIKCSPYEQYSYLKLLTAAGLTGWAFEKHFALC